VELMKKRAEIRIGMPRMLNMYSMTPDVSAPTFASLGIPGENIDLLGLHQRAAL
jgi:predicted nucleotide-binding protein (sugar kinase/HSP70/actin superfamily)